MHIVPHDQNEALAYSKKVTALTGYLLTRPESPCYQKGFALSHHEYPEALEAPPPIHIYITNRSLSGYLGLSMVSSTRSIMVSSTRSMLISYHLIELYSISGQVYPRVISQVYCIPRRVHPRTVDQPGQEDPPDGDYARRFSCAAPSLSHQDGVLAQGRARRGVTCCIVQPIGLSVLDVDSARYRHPPVLEVKSGLAREKRGRREERPK